MADEGALSVTMDSSGNIYAAGQTYGALSGQANLGGSDAFLGKYDSSSNDIWTRQFGSSAHDTAYSVAVDSSGYVYVAGKTDGALPGYATLGSTDAFLKKYDSTGNEVWTHLFGTSQDDEASSIYVDSPGNIYVAGNTTGAFPGQVNSGSRDAFLIRFVPDTEPPDTPAPVSPAGGSFLYTVTPAFTWTAATDDRSSPVFYEIQVATVSSMLSPLIYKTNLAWNAYNLFTEESLSSGGYYWRVRARDSAIPPNYSPWSSPPWSFTVMPRITSTATFLRGWNMFSAPLTPDPADFNTQLGDDIPAAFTVWRYYNLTRLYVQKAQAEPGLGYWVKISSDSPYEVEGFPVVSTNYQIALGKGWNQIGNPFTSNKSWGSLQVKQGAGVPVNMADAVTAGLLNQWLYWYNPSTRSYCQGDSSTANLNPGLGYWVKANVDELTLIIQP